MCFSVLTLAQGLDSPGSIKEAMRQMDSVSQHITLLPDSLLPVYSKADSIVTGFNAKADSIVTVFNATADSLQTQYRKKVSDLEAQTQTINRKIDSLRQIGLPTKKYQRSLNKLSALKEKTEKQFSEKLTKLKSRTTERLKELDLPPQVQEPLDKLTDRINNVNLHTDVRIPELKIPGYELPKVGDIALPTDLENVDIPPLPGVNTPGELTAIPQQAQSYQETVTDIVPDDMTAVTDAEKLQQTLESQASRIEGIDELQKQSGVIDGHKAQLEEITGQVNGLTDPEAAREKAIELTKKAAVNHFAGKEEQLKSAMEKIAKYKQKYSSVSSIKDLPKRPPNAMKDKPFVERLVPGLYLQYQRKNSYLLDVNPYVGYKLSGRITTGLGWNYRIAWDNRRRALDERAWISGPRAYTDFRMGKGFIAHLEVEAMNSFVPSVLAGNPDAGGREWVWSCMTGIKKEYRITRNLKGTALIQYNLFNRFYKAPYVDRLNSRIGFDYQLKRKKHRP